MIVPMGRCRFCSAPLVSDGVITTVLPDGTAFSERTRPVCPHGCSTAAGQTRQEVLLAMTVFVTGSGWLLAHLFVGVPI